MTHLSTDHERDAVPDRPARPRADPPRPDPTGRDRHFAVDVAVLGDSLAGSMLAGILAGHGVRTVLAATGARADIPADGEAGAAAAVVVGPRSGAAVAALAARYRAPGLAAILGVGPAAPAPAGADPFLAAPVGAARTRNTGYVLHSTTCAGPELGVVDATQFVNPRLVPPGPHLAGRDTADRVGQWACARGALPVDARGPGAVRPDPGGPGATLRDTDGTRVRARFVVDTTGALAPALGLELRSSPAATWHARMAGVRPFDGCGAGARVGQPDPWQRGTLHHLVDGGVIRVAPLGPQARAGAASAPAPAGDVAVSLTVAEAPAGADPDRTFAGLLARHPGLVEMFADARTVEGWSGGPVAVPASPGELAGPGHVLIDAAAGLGPCAFGDHLAEVATVVDAVAGRLIATFGAKVADGGSAGAPTDGGNVLDGTAAGDVAAIIRDLRSTRVGFTAAACAATEDPVLWRAVFQVYALAAVLGTPILQQRARTARTAGADRPANPASAVPGDAGYDDLVERTLAARTRVARGGDPSAAAAEIFAALRGSAVVPPAFGFGDPAMCFYHPTPLRMLRALWWARADAPPPIGSAITGSVRAMVADRVLSRIRGPLSRKFAVRLR